jgi:NADH dehydrogenase [ubiquinone] 1 alpha subcomplex assembly factor 5
LSRERCPMNCVLHPRHVRKFAAISSHSSINLNSVGPYQVFDRITKQLQKDKAVLREGGNRSRTVDYVRNEVAERMIERFLVRA